MNIATSAASVSGLNADPSAHPVQTVSENSLDIGTRVAEFEITGIVGEGGFGTVYLAIDHSLQRTVALKEYLPPALASRGTNKNVVVRSRRHQETFDAGLKSFLNEARLLAQFDHPALIKVHRFWEENNTAYMAMRFYEGRTLKDILGETPDATTEAWWKAILKPILEALDVLYSAQILHRDISPENIMIQPGGEPVLLDFGAARRLIENPAQALTVILKPGYAPVEQYADDPSMKQGPWTDIYALSAVVYSSLAKKPPPVSIARLIKDPMEPLTPEVYPGYSQQFLSAIDKGLAVKPDDRPQTTAEFGALLGLDTLPTPGSPTRPTHAKDVNGLGAPPRASSKALAAPTAIASSAISNEERAQRASVQAAGGSPFKGVTYRKWMISAIGVVSMAALGLSLVITNTDDMPEIQPIVADAMLVAPTEVPLARNAGDTGKTLLPVESVSAQTTIAQASSTEPAIAVPRDDTANTSDRKPARAAASDADKPGNNSRQSNKQLSSSAAKVTATIQFNVKPWGTILVDGDSKGVSPPLKTLTLSRGKHQIRVVNPNFQDHVVDLEIKQQGTVRIAHDFSRMKK